MIKQRFTQPSYLIGLVVMMGLLVIAAVYGLGAAPKQHEAKSLNEELEALRKQLEMLESQPDPESFSQEEIDRLAGQVPAKEEPSRLLLDFQDMEDHTNVTIESIQFNDEEITVQDTPIVGKRISMQVGGSYDRVKAFMQSLHEQERVIEVETWQLNTISESDSAVRMDLQLVVFLAPDVWQPFGDNT